MYSEITLKESDCHYLVFSHTPLNLGVMAGITAAILGHVGKTLPSHEVSRRESGSLMTPWNCCISLGWPALKFFYKDRVLKSPGGLIKTSMPSSLNKVSDSGMVWSAKVFIFNKFPGDDDGAMF